MHVVTQACCNDASCVSVCPVNCIHPTPDEPEFATAEMLFIDPETCIDCGACVDVCPVDAIVPDNALDDQQLRYMQVNADYYTDHDVNAGLALPPKAVPLPSDTQLSVAIVGAGPAAFYAAEFLVGHPTVKVDMFDRLPTPYGLVRAGVAPDHSSTKNAARVFSSIAAKPNFTYRLGIEAGKHVSPEELADRYNAVIYAHGASTDKRLGIGGEDLPGSIAATDFVAWYNGHPDYAHLTFDLSSERCVVVGNGNVALDVARILLTDPETLAKTDIADHALATLRASNVTEVVLLARRGVAQAAYTIGEFLAMGDIPGVDVVIDPAELVLDDATARACSEGTLDSTIATKLRIAEEYAASEPSPGNKRVVFRYLVSPEAFAEDATTGTLSVRCVRNVFRSDDDSKTATVIPTAETFVLSAGAVVRAIGYTGQPLPGLPFDKARGIVPNESGRVVASPNGAVLKGVYVTGWIKRGATGGIGMNRVCGEETARAVVADFANGVLPEPIRVPDDLHELAAARGAVVIDEAGWNNIDDAEQAAGRKTGRSRVKFVYVDDLLAASRGH